MVLTRIRASTAGSAVSHKLCSNFRALMVADAVDVEPVSSRENSRCAEKTGKSIHFLLSVEPMCLQFARMLSNLWAYSRAGPIGNFLVQ
jgi:hypothetical protein